MRKTLIILVWIGIVCGALAAVQPHLRGLLAWTGLVAILLAAGLTVWKEAIRAQKAREQERPKPALPVINFCFNPAESSPYCAWRANDPDPIGVGPTKPAAITDLLKWLKSMGLPYTEDDYEFVEVPAAES